MSGAVLLVPVVIVPLGIQPAGNQLEVAMLVAFIDFEQDATHIVSAAIDSGAGAVRVRPGGDRKPAARKR